MKKPRNEPTAASFSHGGAAVFVGGVRPVERDELDVVGYLRTEKNKGGERKRVGGVLYREKDLFYFFLCV